MQLLLLVCVVYWTLGRTNSEVLKKHIYFYLCLEDTREAPPPSLIMKPRHLFL